MTTQRLLPHSPDQQLPLYDSEAVRHLLLRASAIQEREQQAKLSGAQVTALAKELGIAPEAVRQALAEAALPYPVAATAATPRQQKALPRLTVAQMLTTPLPGLLYGVFLAVFFADPNLMVPGASPALVAATLAVIYLLPALLAGVLGWLRGDVRTGGLVGAFLTLFTWAGLTIGLGLAHGSEEVGFTPGFLAPLLITALLGVLSGWLRRRWDAERAERRWQQER